MCKNFIDNIASQQEPAARSRAAGGRCGPSLIPPPLAVASFSACGGRVPGVALRATGGNRLLD